MGSSPDHFSENGDAQRFDLLRTLVYGLAAAVWLSPLATTFGVVVSLLMIPLGLYLAAFTNERRIRWPIVVAGAALVSLLAVNSDHLLGWIPAARLLGVEGALHWSEVTTFAPLTLAVALGLRRLTMRFAALQVLELGAAAASTIWLCAGHRDMNLGRPRLLTDWAIGQGLDPSDVLLAIGVATSGLAALVLLPRRHGRQAAAGGALLIILSAVGYAALSVWLPQGNLANALPEGSSRQGNSQSGDNSQVGKSKSAGGSAEDDMPFTPPDETPPSKPVAIVVLHDDYLPPSGVWYFRSSALSQFNGRRFVRASQQGFDGDTPKQFPQHEQSLPMAASADVETQEVRMTVGLVDQPSRPLALVNPALLQPTENPNPKLFTRCYDVKSRVLKLDEESGANAEYLFYVRQAAIAAGDKSWDDATRAHYVEAPSDPRYGKLAAQIVDEAIDWSRIKPQFRNSPVLTALAIRRHLETNMTYSMKPGHDPQSDPVAQFLFGNHKGYCVHIAHATVALLRSRGIPARVATGFAVPAENMSTQTSVTIQSTDAHAWAEMYLEGIGWVVMDSQLEKADPDTPKFPPPDADTSRLLADQMRPRAEQGPAAPPSTVAWAVPGFGIALLLAALCPYAVKLWRRLAPLVLPDAVQYRVVFRAVLDRLAELDLVRRHGETREEFARRIAEIVPHMPALTLAHQRCAGGSCESSRLQWRALKDSVDAEIDHAFPCIRRWLALAHPLAWLRTR
ncbi:MAG: hypothetical protein KDA42_02145 [Planctomycetales bacterium]|nr:hypothetical protein [Planctomycetales bacterium]